MVGFAIFLPIILLLGTIFFLTRLGKPTKFQLNKKLTYTIVGAYAVILLIATVTVEAYEKKFAVEPPEVTSVEDANFNGPFFEGSEDFDSIDPSRIIEKRTHTAGNRLQLNTKDDQLDVRIFIERKSQNDGVIEETIYKPILFNDGFDFSDRFQYTLPKWNEDTVFFPRQPETIINYFTYHDAFLISQFTDNSIDNTYSRSYGGGMSRHITIHLLVPKDLIIDADENLYVTYMDE